jgi:hypothetical protein
MKFRNILLTGSVSYYSRSIYGSGGLAKGKTGEEEEFKHGLPMV